MDSHVGSLNVTIASPKIQTWHGNDPQLVLRCYIVLIVVIPFAQSFSCLASWDWAIADALLQERIVSYSSNSFTHFLAWPSDLTSSCRWSWGGGGNAELIREQRKATSVREWPACSEFCSEFGSILSPACTHQQSWTPLSWGATPGGLSSPSNTMHTTTVVQPFYKQLHENLHQEKANCVLFVIRRFDFRHDHCKWKILGRVYVLSDRLRCTTCTNIGFSISAFCLRKAEIGGKGHWQRSVHAVNWQLISRDGGQAAAQRNHQCQ